MSVMGPLKEFGCPVVGSRAPEEASPLKVQEWSTAATLPTGRVHVSGMPIASGEQQLGFVVILANREP